MKQICILLGVLIINHVQGQQQQGRVVYEFTRQVHLRMAGMGEGPGQMIPRTHTEKVEVLFANNKSIRRQLEEDMPPDFAAGGGENIQIRMVGGADDITWHDFTADRKVEQREFATKQYLITDSVQKLNWKLTGESKTILGFACQQALATRISKRTEVSMENGVINRKEVPDTSNIVAWFTPAIPVSAGPDYQGQLPGLILQIDINGNPGYKAIEVSPKVDVAAIKEPKGGKKVTMDEFNKERDKVMEEMHKNGGGMRMRRMN
jgi:GLPGLI family protein